MDNFREKKIKNFLTSTYLLTSFIITKILLEILIKKFSFSYIFIEKELVIIALYSSFILAFALIYHSFDFIENTHSRNKTSLSSYNTFIYLLMMIMVECLHQNLHLPRDIYDSCKALWRRGVQIENCEPITYPISPILGALVLCVFVVLITKIVVVIRSYWPDHGELPVRIPRPAE